MIHGIGVDLIEIDRIKVLYSKQPKLVQTSLSTPLKFDIVLASIILTSS